MDGKPNREGTAAERNTVPAVPAGGAAPAAPFPDDRDDGIRIDFHSADFNRTDDLNDYSGNYRTFQPLDGVTTADMRHQRERRRQGAAGDPSAAAPAPARKGRTAPGAAEAGDAPSPLTVTSRGRTLILAPDTGTAVACGERLGGQGLNCTLLVIRNGVPDVAHAGAGGMALLEAGTVSVRGGFGGFSATVAVAGGQRDLGDWLDGTPNMFDLVLDLQTVPSFAGTSLPLGYYAPGADPARIGEAMEELPEMRGRFHKPQFVTFRDNRCIRGRSRTTDCRRCLLICPYGAIGSRKRSVSINQYLCQGCGGCALVCPADAIRRTRPSHEELLLDLQHRLSSRPAGTDHPTILLISAAAPPAGNAPGEEGETHPAGAVRLGVEHIGHVGLEVLLAAPVYGADGVIVAPDPQDPLPIQEAVKRQVGMAEAILRGLGAEENVRFVSPAGDVDTGRTAGRATGTGGAPSGDPPRTPPSPSFAQDRRTVTRLMVQHLCARSGTPRSWLPLPAGSPFGAVTVDPAACTLCMACAAACPAGALVAHGDLPRLEFTEAHCHQCGLCAETCPEAALRLLPRMLCDRRAAETPTVLHQAEPFCCVECGAPFATRAMVERMQGRLTGHRMYTGDRRLRRLQMCGTCRTADALASEDMGTWSRE